jgi:hypothetical protein
MNQLQLKSEKRSQLAVGEYDAIAIDYISRRNYDLDQGSCLTFPIRNTRSDGPHDVAKMKTWFTRYVCFGHSMSRDPTSFVR